jgi:hypothetical protein
VFVGALVRANRSLLDGWNGANCARRPFDERVLCANGMEIVLDRFAREPGVVSAIRARAEDPACAPKEWKTAPDRPCLVDRTFHNLILNRSTFVESTARTLLQQLWRVEDRIGRDYLNGAYTHASNESTAEAIGVLYRTVVGNARPGTIDWDPSSIENSPDHPGSLVAMQLLPYSVATSVQAGGIDATWFRPAFNISRKLSVVFPLTFNYRPPAVRGDSSGRSDRLDDPQYYLGAGTGLLWRSRSLRVSGVELTPQLLYLPEENRFHGAVGGAVYVLGGKLRLGTRYVWETTPELHRGKSFDWTLGIADFNGLMYWLWRGLG